MEGEIIASDQNSTRPGGVYGDWLAFGASLNWPFEVFGTPALVSFFSLGGTWNMGKTMFQVIILTHY